MQEQASWIVRIAVVSASLGAACGGGGAGDTLPSGWVGAQALTIEQTTCKSGAPSASPSLELSESGGMITCALKDIQLRCEQQACAYVTDSGATTRVLVQPCDLHPTSVAKCSCPYDVSLTLAARAGRTAVEVYKRDDFYGASAPPQPVMVASKPVGGAALHWYKTCGDPVCFVGDGGAGSPDAGIAACTTEKPADACATSGATCDPGDGCHVRLLCTDKDPRVQPGGCPISRRAAKRDLSYLDDAALNELAARLRDLRLARYRYKDAPRIERLGFVIDDGAGAIAVDEARDQIDLYSYLSWTVAALQVEVKRADAIERELAQLRRQLARHGKLRPSCPGLRRLSRCPANASAPTVPQVLSRFENAAASPSTASGRRPGRRRKPAISLEVDRRRISAGASFSRGSPRFLLRGPPFSAIDTGR